MKYVKSKSSSPPFHVISYIWKYNFLINWDWLIISIIFFLFFFVFLIWFKSILALKLIQYTIHWEKTNNEKTELKHKIHHFSKNFFGIFFSYFDSVLFLLKFIFLLNKKYGLFDFKGASIKNYESVKKGKFVTKTFCQIILNKILHPQFCHFCKWIK